MDRFWSKADKSGDCWLWAASKTESGYGKFGWRVDGRHTMARAHRVAWELTNGPVPTNTNVLHRCDNPSCVNPAHLFLGSQTDNMRDMIHKGRRRASVGNARLNDAQVERIRASNERASVLAAEHGVCVSHIHAIKREAPALHDGRPGFP